MRRDLLGPVSIVFSLALVSHRYLYAFISNAFGPICAGVIGLLLLLTCGGMAAASFERVFRPRSRVRISSLALFFLGVTALSFWWDHRAGDLFVDRMSIPTLERYSRVAAWVEEGTLKPNSNGSAQLPPGEQDLSLGGSVEVEGTPPDARIEFTLRQIGTSCLVAVYEPRRTLRKLETDDSWWRRVSKKAPHWYLVVWADWD
jgi:hypothetical protein